MADKQYPLIQNSTGQADVPIIKYVDQGDGTQAQAVYIVNGSAGGGGGAVTLADGADATQGSKADVAASNDTGTFSIVSLFKRLLGKTPALGAAPTANSSPTTIATDDAQFGTEATGFTASSGATGLRGRLSEISTAIRQWVSSPTPIQDIAVSGNISALNGAITTTTLNGAQSGIVYVSGTYAGTIVCQITLDGTNWQSVDLAPISQSTGTTNVGNIPSGGSGFYAFNAYNAQAARALMNTYTSGTANVELRVGQSTLAAYSITQSISVDKVNGQSAVTLQPGGASGNALTTDLAAATNNTDYNAAAWAAATGTAAIIADAHGVSTGFVVNLGTYTGGSAVGIDIFLDITRDGGTTWETIWQCERLSAAGTAIIPALFMEGRRRFRWTNVNSSNVATAATTATVTVTASRVSGVSGKGYRRQFFDRTAGLLSGTSNAVSAGYDTGGSSTISAIINVGTAATPGQYKLQVCSFNSGTDSDWADAPGTSASATVTANGSTRITATGITERFFRVKSTGTSTSQTGNYVALTAS